MTESTGVGGAVVDVEDGVDVEDVTGAVVGGVLGAAAADSYFTFCEGRTTL
jgi:hypothetical protein